MFWSASSVRTGSHCIAGTVKTRIAAIGASTSIPRTERTPGGPAISSRGLAGPNCTPIWWRRIETSSSMNGPPRRPIVSATARVRRSSSCRFVLLASAARCRTRTISRWRAAASSFSRAEPAPSERPAVGSAKSEAPAPRAGRVTSLEAERIVPEAPSSPLKASFTSAAGTQVIVAASRPARVSAFGCSRVNRTLPT